jgi:hypothetical protein
MTPELECAACQPDWQAVAHGKVLSKFATNRCEPSVFVTHSNCASVLTGSRGPKYPSNAALCPYPVKPPPAASGQLPVTAARTLLNHCARTSVAHADSGASDEAWDDAEPRLGLVGAALPAVAGLQCRPRVTWIVWWGRCPVHRGAAATMHGAARSSFRGQSGQRGRCTPGGPKEGRFRDRSGSCRPPVNWSEPVHRHRPRILGFVKLRMAIGSSVFTPLARCPRRRQRLGRDRRD